MRKSTLVLLTAAFVILAVNASVGPAAAADGSLNLSWTLLDNYLRPSDETTLILDVQNMTSWKIYNIDVSFVTKPDLTTTLSEFSLYVLPDMNHHSTSLKITAADNAASGIYYIEITAKYHVENLNADEEELRVWVPLAVVSEPLLKVEGLEYDLSVIEPGSDVTVSFDVKNYGDGIAKDLVVSLDQTSGFFTADLNEKYVGEVPVNGSRNISFNLTINQGLDVGSYTIPIMLVYKDETRREVLSGMEYAGIKVYGNINLITTLNSQDSVASGTSGEMEIKIANAGTMEVEFLQLNILETSVLVDIIPSNIYIGSLKSDDYDTERISFKVGESVASGVYPISLQLDYKDPFGQEFTETKTVDLRVLSAGELGDNVGLPVWQMVLVLAVAALIVYYVLRKRRK